MQIIENKYIVEVNAFKSLAKAAVLGTSIAGMAIGGAKLAGVGRFAPQPTEAPSQAPIKAIVQPAAPVQTTPKAETPKAETKKPSPEQLAHDKFHQGLQNKYGAEYSTILNAAKRNGIQETDHDKLAMLFAIRKTEGGAHGKQFGVLHPKAYAKPGESKQQSLDRQAGWASYILNKREGEWNSMSSNDQGQYQGFHHYLQSKYAPHGASNDPRGLNKNWLGNFTTHYNENIGFKE
jgi:hypothetical protein